MAERNIYLSTIEPAEARAPGPKTPSPAQASSSRRKLPPTKPWAA